MENKTREILYRGKAVGSGAWVKGVPCGNIMIRSFYFPRLGDEDPSSEIPLLSLIGIDPKAIGEYTGLTDKNGVKIFEGDILRNNGGEKFVVAYSEKWVRFVAQEVENGLMFEWSMWDANKVTEVIGNIHDNPELLKGEKWRKI